jgi:uncharacterized protein YecE (DUF72 family)
VRRVLWIGTSGWQYRDWRRSFYPDGVPQRRWLEHYAERFATVEVNNTFYRLPRRETFEQWAERVPPDFLMGAKLSRFLSHMKKLREPEEPVARFLDRAAPLGDRLGPVLLQLPETFQADLGLLADFLALWPRTVRLAFEARHQSWFTDDVAALLADHDVPLCLADRRGRLTPTWRTASWGYVRFHEGRDNPSPCYGLRELAGWVDVVADLWGPDDDVFVYFNNDPNACALADAVRFAGLAAKVGLRPTRVPDADEVRVGAYREAA